MPQTVVTELVIQNDSAPAVNFARVMASAQLAAEQAKAANDNLSRSMKTSSDNARDAAEKHNGLTTGLRAMARGTLDAAEAMAKKAVIGATVAAVMGTLLGVLLPLYAAYKLIKAAIDLVSDAWGYGTQKLAEYVDIAKKAAAVDLSTAFFQKITKAATDAKLPVDDLTAALKSLAAVSTEKLGGSDLQNRLDASVKAGNFGGNTGVGQFASANTTEEKFRAIVSLIDRAMQKGERLAALDISSKAFGPAITANLLKDSEYLTRMVVSADKLAVTEIISDAQIGRALALQNSYDAAVKILETRWHPIQDLLTSLGIKMHEAWVGIVVQIANAVDWATRLIAKLGEAPSWFQNKLNQGATAFMEATTTPESRKAAEQSLGISSDPADIAATKAANDRAEVVARLTAGLQNKNAVEQAAAQVNTIQNAIWKDTSKTLDDVAKKTSEVRDQYDRAKDAIEKHTGRLIADKDAIGLGVGAQEEFRAKSALTIAAKQAEIPVTAALTAEIDKLAKAQGVAADALERAKIQSQIKFGKDTALLSQEDVQIASQLKGIYPDVATALGSVEAQSLRTNNQLKQMNDIARSSATSFSDDLIKGLASGQKGVEALHNAFKNLSSSLTSGALQALFRGDLLSAAVLGIAAGVSAIFSANTSSSGDKWLAQQIEGRDARLAEIRQRTAAIGVDVQTRQGAIIAQDAQFTQERLAENKGGGQAMNELLRLQTQERAALLAEWDKKETEMLQANADAKLAIEKAIADRSLGFQNRLFAAANDNKTLEGQLAAFDRAASQERAQEVQAGGQVIVDLEAAQAAERLNVIKTYNDRITEASEQAAKAQLDAVNGIGRSVTDYLNNLISGPGSTLSPTDTLSNAQSVYNANLALAIGGNTDAQSKFPQLADNLEKAARAVYASAQGYQDIRSQILSQGLSLPAVQNATDPVVIEMRNVLAAINAGNATQALDATLQNVIKAAIDAGNAQQVAAALLPTMGNQLTFQQFVDKVAPLAKDTTAASLLTSSQIASFGLANDATVAQLLNAGQLISALGPISRDTTVGNLATAAQLASNLGPIAKETTLGSLPNYSQFQGLGLSRDITVGSLLTQSQLQNSGLAANVTVGNVQSAINALNVGNILKIFNEIDANDDNIINKTEAIRAASVDTRLYTSNTEQNTGSLTGNVATTRMNTEQSNLFLSSMNNFSDRIIAALNEQGSMQSASYSRIILNGKLLLNWMPQLVYGGPGSKAAGADGGGISEGIPYSSHATGGVIPAGGLGLVMEHFNPTLLRAGPEPITVSPFAPMFRGSNDNGSNAALLSRIDKLTEQVEVLQKIVAGSGANVARAVIEGTDKVADKVDGQTDTLASQERQSNRQRKVA